MRRFEIWACNARVADCAQDDAYQRAFISGADAFPADAPRPVAPMLLLRTFKETDCNTAGPDPTKFVRVADLQAFGAASRVQ